MTLVRCGGGLVQAKHVQRQHMYHVPIVRNIRLLLTIVKEETTFQITNVSITFTDMLILGNIRVLLTFTGTLIIH